MNKKPTGPVAPKTLPVRTAVKAGAPARKEEQAPPGDFITCPGCYIGCGILGIWDSRCDALCAEHCQ